MTLTLWAGCVCPLAHAQFHASELRALSRTGVQVGTSVDVTVVAGDRLDEVNQLYFSHPGIEATQQTLDPLPFSTDRIPQSGRFTVTVSKEVPPGRYEVRAFGRHGLSNPRAFLVNSLENVPPASVSHDAVSPTPLPLGKIIHTTSTAAEEDWYRLHVDAPMTLRVEVIAQRVDSPMIAQVAVYGSDGRRVAASRGADRFDPDLTLVDLAAGDYTLSVHDFLYRGGNEYPYQIVTQAAASAADFIARSDETVGQLPRHWRTSASTLAKNTSEFETNTPAGETTKLQPIEAPSITAWWFSSDNSDSVFEFAAKKDQRFAVEVVSERIDQPTDARLIIQRVEPQPADAKPEDSKPGNPIADVAPKLHDLVNVDDAHNVGDAALSLRTKDPVAMLTAPMDATYRLVVRDLDVGQSLRTRQRFVLQVRKPDPGFDLVAYRVYPNRDVNQSRGFGSKLFRGGAEGIRILAVRRDGWTGPIRLTAENLPEGVQCNEVILAANQNQTQLTLTASEKAPANVSAVQIVGHSSDDAISIPAQAATLLAGRGGGRDFIRSRLVTDLRIAVSAQDDSPLSFGFGGDKPLEGKKGAAISIPIQLTRRDGGKAACVLRARDLPPGVTAADVTIPADKSEANLELKINSGAVPGTYSLWLQVETKIKVKPNPQALSRAELYRAHLKTLHDDPTQAKKLESIKAAIVIADKNVESAKAAAKEIELAVFLPTPNATFRVVDP